MRLARPLYESLPYLYALIGAFALVLFYIDPAGPRGLIAFLIGFLAETAALTLCLRRQDYRALSREYSGDSIDGFHLNG